MERAIDAAEQSAEGPACWKGSRWSTGCSSGPGKTPLFTREAEGSVFDPAHHEAMMQEPSSEPKGTVTRVCSKDTCCMTV